MPKVSINLSEAESRKPLPDDTYQAEVTEITGPHKGPKAKYLAAKMKITEGDFAGKIRTRNLPIEGPGAGMLADFVSKCTGQEIDVDELDKLDLDTDDLIGSPIAFQTKQKEYPEGSGEYNDEIVKILKVR